MPELVGFFPSEMNTWVKIICPSTSHPLSVVVAQVLFSIAVWRGANGTRALPTLPQVGGYVEVQIWRKRWIQDVFRQFKVVTGVTFHDLNPDILHILTDEFQDGQCWCHETFCWNVETHFGQDMYGQVLILLFRDSDLAILSILFAKMTWKTLKTQSIKSY